MRVRPLYFTRRALEAMVRGPYVALVGTATVFVALLSIGLLAAALGGAERLLGAWAGEVRISAYLAPGADLDGARAAVAAAAPGRAVSAVTGAEALARLREELGDEGRVLEGVGPGVLPDAVEVAAPGITLAGARALAARLRAVPGVDDVDYGTAWLEALERFVRGARAVAWLVFGAMAAASAVLVSNTLRLAVHARHDEIEIMKLVGATDAFVAAPFLLEGMFQGLLGGGLAALVLAGANAAALPRLTAAAPALGALAARDTVPGALLAALVLGGVAVGLLGSALSVARALRRA